MTISRCNFLKLGGLTAVAISATACNVIGQKINEETLPENLSLPIPSPNILHAPVDPIFRLIFMHVKQSSWQD